MAAAYQKSRPAHLTGCLEVSGVCDVLDRWQRQLRG